MKRITLLYPHTHNGVAHASGISLELPDVWAGWLVDHGIAVPAASGVTVTVPAPAAVTEPTTTSLPPIAAAAATGDDHDAAN